MHDFQNSKMTNCVPYNGVDVVLLFLISLDLQHRLVTLIWTLIILDIP